MSNDLQQHAIRNLEVFMDQLIQEAGMGSIPEENKALMRSGMIDMLLDEIDRRAIYSLTEDQAAELAKRIDDPNFTAQMIAEFNERCGVDYEKITQEAMIDFREAFLASNKNTEPTDVHSEKEAVKAPETYDDIIDMGGKQFVQYIVQADIKEREQVVVICLEQAARELIDSGIKEKDGENLIEALWISSMKANGKLEQEEYELYLNVSNRFMRMYNTTGNIKTESEVRKIVEGKGFGMKQRLRMTDVIISSYLSDHRIYNNKVLMNSLYMFCLAVVSADRRIEEDEKILLSRIG